MSYFRWSACLFGQYIFRNAYFAHVMQQGRLPDNFQVRLVQPRAPPKQSHIQQLLRMPKVNGPGVNGRVKAYMVAV
jgi:hypothetical protein